MELKTSTIVSGLQDLYDGKIDVYIVKDATEETIKEFGELAKQDVLQTEVVRIGYDGTENSLMTHSDMQWHNDGFHLSNPTPFAALYCEDVEQGASPTHFCDMKSVWSSLPDAMKDKLKEAEPAEYAAKNWAKRDLTWPYEFTDKKAEALYLRFAKTLRSLYRSDKYGEYLCFSPAYTTTDLLEELSKVFKDEYIYTHCWNPKDLVVWNNFTISHKRDTTPKHIKRRLVRYALNEFKD